MRNNSTYDIKILSRDGEHHLVLRDSNFLLTSSLKDLETNIYPELGAKRSLDHENMMEELFHPMRSEILEYLRQDVLLLDGILQNTQNLYSSEFGLDVTNGLTVSMLAFTIFRLMYYDPMKTPIYMATKNVDSFIRCGYYGGYSDVYRPIGENLLVYDVKFLYPFIMLEFPMPCGAPVWYRSLKGIDLSDQLGLVQAYVKFPSCMNRPFLPYRNEDRNKDQILIFPTGKWIGVYFTK